MSPARAKIATAIESTAVHPLLVHVSIHLNCPALSNGSVLLLAPAENHDDGQIAPHFIFWGNTTVVPCRRREESKPFSLTLEMKSMRRSPNLTVKTTAYLARTSANETGQGQGDALSKRIMTLCVTRRGRGLVLRPEA